MDDGWQGIAASCQPIADGFWLLKNAVDDPIKISRRHQLLHCQLITMVWLARLFPIILPVQHFNPVLYYTNNLFSTSINLMVNNNQGNSWGEELVTRVRYNHGKQSG